MLYAITMSTATKDNDTASTMLMVRLVELKLFFLPSGGNCVGADVGMLVGRGVGCLVGMGLTVGFAVGCGVGCGDGCGLWCKTEEK